MTITLNGESKEIPDGLSVASLLAHLGLDAGRVAVERNREIVPREQWAETMVQAGDTYEIVQFVGGG